MDHIFIILKDVKGYKLITLLGTITTSMLINKSAMSHRTIRILALFSHVVHVILTVALTDFINC